MRYEFTDEKFDEWVNKATPAFRRFFLEEEEILLKLIRPGYKILEIGVGTGRTFERLSKIKGCQLTGVDHSELQLNTAKNKLKTHHDDIKLILASAANLPFDDNSFDLVCMLWNLVGNLTPDERLRSLTEAKRVLREGGILFITTFAENAAPFQIELYSRRGIPYEDPFGNQTIILEYANATHASESFTQEQLERGLKFFKFHDIKIEKFAGFAYACTARK